METPGLLICFIVIIRPISGDYLGKINHGSYSLPDFSPCHTNIVVNEVVDFPDGPVTLSPMTLYRFKVTINPGTQYWREDQYNVAPDMLPGIELSNWRGPSCWVHIFQLTPYIAPFKEFLQHNYKQKEPVMLTDEHRSKYTESIPYMKEWSLQCQLRKAFTAAAIVFAYNGQSHSKGDKEPFRKSRLGPIVSYFMLLTDPYAHILPKKFLEIIPKTLMHFAHFLSENGDRNILSPNLDLARIAVVLINSSRLEDNTYGFVYLCVYCESIRFSGKLYFNDPGLKNTSLLNWIDGRNYANRVHKWEITPSGVSQMYSSVATSPFFKRSIKKPNDELILTSTSIPQFSFEIYVLETLKDAGNVTFRTNVYSELFGSSHLSRYFEMFEMSVSHRPLVSVNVNPSGFQQSADAMNDPDLFRPEIFIVTSSDGLNFLTCFSIETRSLKMYTISFNDNLWISLLVIVPVIAVIIHIYIKTQVMEDYSFSSYLMMFSSLVEHSFSIPQKLISKLPFRLIIGSWFLMVTIFTNGYKGTGISQLISPLPKESVTHFENITAEKWITNGNLSFSEFKEGARRLTQYPFGKRQPNPRDFRILSVVHSGAVTLSPHNRYDFSRQTKTYFVKELESFMRDRGYSEVRFSHPFHNYFNLTDSLENLVLRLALPVNTFFSNVLYNLYDRYYTPNGIPPSAVFGSANEAELIKCNEDLFVYADMESMVNTEYEYLSRHYPWIRFYRGTQVILHKSVGWHFSTQGNPAFPECFKTLMSSGIYLMLHKMYIFKLYQFRERDTRKRINVKWQHVQPIHMSGNIHTIFLIYLLLISLLVSYFVIEIRSVIYNQLCCLGKKLHKFTNYVGFRILSILTRVLRFLNLFARRKGKQTRWWRKDRR